MTFGEVVKRLGGISADVKAMKETVKDQGRLYLGGVAVVGVLLAIMAIR